VAQLTAPIGKEAAKAAIAAPPDLSCLEGSHRAAALAPCTAVQCDLCTALVATIIPAISTTLSAVRASDAHALDTTSEWDLPGAVGGGVARVGPQPEAGGIERTASSALSDERLRREAHGAVWRLLAARCVQSQSAPPDGQPELFACAHGPAGWLVIAGLGMEPVSPTPAEQSAALRSIAMAIAELPEVQAAGGIRTGLGRGSVAGDLVGGPARGRYEVVGPAVHAAADTQRPGVAHL